jgi:hypothetical protein
MFVWVLMSIEGGIVVARSGWKKQLQVIAELLAGTETAWLRKALVNVDSGRRRRYCRIDGDQRSGDGDQRNGVLVETNGVVMETSRTECWWRPTECWWRPAECWWRPAECWWRPAERSVGWDQRSADGYQQNNVVDHRDEETMETNGMMV